MRFLLILVASTSMCIGATRADYVMQWWRMSPGALANAYSATNALYGSYDSVTPGASTSWSVVSSNFTLNWPSPISISNQTFTTIGTNWLLDNTQIGGAREDMFILSKGQGAGISNFMVSGFMVCNVTNSAGLDKLEIVTSFGTNWGVLQVKAARTTDFTIIAHTPPGEGNFLTNTIGKTLFYRLFWNATRGTNYVYINDPANAYALLGKSELGLTAVGGAAYELSLISDYVSAATTNFLFSDFAVMYNPTDAEVDGMITNVSSSPTTTATFGVASGGSIGVK